MAPLNIKEIVNVSSEDEKFPATNLMCGQKWLSNSCKQKDEVFIEVKTEIPCQVTYIDIGYFNVALLEIHVALSSWPSYREYLTLVPTVKLQSPADARSGRNKTGCKMLNFDDHMNQEIAKLDWDKFKLVLHQPYARNKQLGIEFVRLGTSKSTKNDSTVKFVKTPTLATKEIIQSPPPANSSNHLEQSKSSSPSLQFQSKLKGMSGSGSNNSEAPLGRNAKMVVSSKLKFQKESILPSSIKVKSSDDCKDAKHSLLRQNHNVKKLLKKETFENTTVTHSMKISSSAALQASRRKTMESINKTRKEVRRSAPPSNIAYVSSATNCPKIELNDENCQINQSSQIERKNRNVIHFDRTDTSNSPKYRKQHHVSIKKEFPSNDFEPVNSELRNHITRNDDVAARHASKSLKCEVLKEESDQSKIVFEQSDVSEASTSAAEEPVYTDQQIRQLKKAIKRFFNKLDMDSIDPHNQKLKDLRRQFESEHDVKLNKDGRGYFREITTRYITLVWKSRQHKKRKADESADITSAKERKSLNPNSSTASFPVSKQPISTRSEDKCKVLQQCPICLENFDESVINVHAALCDRNNQSPSEHLITQASSCNFNQMEDGLNDSVVDCSRNSCLSENEQQKWIRFSLEPKPYHERLNRSSFAGCTLVRCPSCGQKYKSTEIALHCDDCVSKVNSGCTRMGLYLVEPKSNKQDKKFTAANRKAYDETIVLD